MPQVVRKVVGVLGPPCLAGLPEGRCTRVDVPHYDPKGNVALLQSACKTKNCPACDLAVYNGLRGELEGRKVDRALRQGKRR